MQRQFDVVIYKDREGYYVASVPALCGCHTQAKSLDVIMERIKEAIALCLEVQDEADEPHDFVCVQRVTVVHGKAAEIDREAIDRSIGAGRICSGSHQR